MFCWNKFPSRCRWRCNRIKKSLIFANFFFMSSRRKLLSLLQRNFAQRLFKKEDNFLFCQKFDESQSKNLSIVKNGPWLRFGNSGKTNNKFFMSTNFKLMISIKSSFNQSQEGFTVGFTLPKFFFVLKFF